MSALDPYIGAIKAFVLVAIALGLFWAGHHFGAQGVQADWNKDIADRAKVEKAAVLARVSENQGIFRQQEITNQNITKVKDDELDKVRADLSHSERMRIGSAICPRSAGTAQTAGASSSDGSDTSSGVLSESMDRSVKALILEMEQVAATGRACQSFVQKNGLAP